MTLAQIRTKLPTLRLRRLHGSLFASWADVLQHDLHKLPSEWEERALIALRNRKRVHDVASEVLQQSSRIHAAGAPLARSLIADATLVAALDDHQCVNVALMTQPGGWGCAIFDEQGTGKSLTLIAAYDLLVERQEAELLIIVAPKSMVGEWAAEFNKFTGDLYRVVTLNGRLGERARLLDSGPDIVVTNYEGVVSFINNLRVASARAKTILAVDESFFVKNPVAARTQAVSELREWCSRAYVLCGTPAPNAARDIVSQVSLVDFGFTFSDWKPSQDADGESSMIRTALGERSVYSRNTKKKVLPDLPRRQFTRVGVILAAQQRAIYDRVRQSLLTDLQTTTDVTFSRELKSFLERRNMLLRICSNPSAVEPSYNETPAKLSALDELLDRLVSKSKKIVLWSFYRASLDVLAARYQHLGLVRIDGSVGDVAQRRAAVKQFQEDDETMIFLGNPAAAGAGITLHRAHIAIYESLSNQAAHYLQSLDRIHRRGQTHAVEYFSLIASDTIEELEYDRLIHKAQEQAKLLGDPVDTSVTRHQMLTDLLVEHAPRVSQHS